MSAADAGSPSGQALPGPGLGDFQIQLISALMAQTEAINRLAQSNEAMTNSIALLLDQIAGGDGDDGLAASQYMDGTPVR